jgi:hypothetical protein
VFALCCAVNGGDFLGCVGIEFAAYNLQMIQYVDGFSMLGAFEQHVLQTVGKPRILVVVFAPCIDRKSGMDQLGSSHTLMYNPQAIRQSN